MPAAIVPQMPPIPWTPNASSESSYSYFALSNTLCGVAGLPSNSVPYCSRRSTSIDDSLDAFGVHGIGGIWGTIAAGIWATKAVNPNGVDGLLYGNPAQLWIQLKAVGIAAAYSFVASLILFKLVDLVVGLRVTEQEELVGLDLTQHREAGYTIID